MKTVLVTGASQRLGLYLVEKFLEDGWDVVGVSRASSPELDRIKEKSDKIKVYKIRKYSSESAKNLLDYIFQNDIAIDLIINNASIYLNDRQVLSSKSIAPQDLFDVHFMFPEALIRGVVNGIKNADREMSVVNITDIYVDNPNMNYSIYCSSKSALESLTKSMAKLYAPNVRVNSIKPGPIQFLKSHKASEKSEVLGETLIPVEPGFEPILKGVRYLFDNYYVTGSSVYIDGGRSLNR